MNSQSGKGGASYLLEQALGVTFPRWMQIEIAQPIQKESERREGELNTQDILNVFRTTFMNSDGRYSLAGYQVDKHGSQYHIQASVNDGSQMMLVHGNGNGAISAFADAMHKATGLDAQIVQFDEQAVAEGSDASAMAFVQASIRGNRYTAVSQDGDTLTASLTAILSAINNAMIDSQAVA